MTTKIREKYRMRFVPLTPIHIGTGDEIEPLEYKIVKYKDDRIKFYRLNLLAMIQSLPSSKRVEFLRLADSGNMIPLRRFVEENADLAKHKFYEAVVCSSVYGIYDKKRNNLENALRINPTYRRLDTWQAVIPGSSIKGAIRTAILSQELTKSVNNGYSVKAGNFYLDENQVFKSNNIQDDPFRTVLIEDMSLPEDSILVAETEIISRRPEKDKQATGGIQQFYEMTFAHLMEEEIFGTGFLTLFCGLSPKFQSENTRQCWKSASNESFRIAGNFIMIECGTSMKRFISVENIRNVLRFRNNCWTFLTVRLSFRFVWGIFHIANR